MNKILIPCLFIVLFSIIGILFFMTNNKNETTEFNEEESPMESIIKNITEQNPKDNGNKLPERKISVDVDKKTNGEECNSGIIKCDVKNGCKRQC